MTKIQEEESRRKEVAKEVEAVKKEVEELKGKVRVLESRSQSAPPLRKDSDDPAHRRVA